jgi:hypothetical protein
VWEGSLVSEVTGYRLYGLGLITDMGRDFSPHHVNADTEVHPMGTGDSLLRDEWSEHKFE